MALTISASTRFVLRGMAHIADKAIASSNDDPASLAAVAQNLRQPDGSYRPLVIKVQGGNDLTIDFPNLPADDVKAGEAIRDRIATALLPTLMTSASSAGKRIGDETVFLQAQKIAMLIADGSLHQAVTQPVKDGFPNMGEPQSALNVVLSSNDHFPAVTLCHSATWRGDNQKPLFETNLVARFSVTDQGNLMADHDVHFYADPSVAPRGKTRILESIRHFLERLFQVRHIEITPCSIQTAAELEHLKMTGTRAASGDADEIVAEVPDRSSETGQVNLPPLNDLAKNTFTARYSKSKPVNTGDTHDVVSPIYRSEEAFLDKLHHSPKETFSALRNSGINVQVKNQTYACAIAAGNLEQIIVTGPDSADKARLRNELIICHMLHYFNTIINRAILHSPSLDLAKGKDRRIVANHRVPLDMYRKDAIRAETIAERIIKKMAGALKASCANCGELAYMAATLVNVFSEKYLQTSRSGISSQAEIWGADARGDHAFCVVKFRVGDHQHEWAFDPWDNIVMPMDKFLQHAQENPRPPFTSKDTTFYKKNKISRVFQNQIFLDSVEDLFKRYGINGLGVHGEIDEGLVTRVNHERAARNPTGAES